MLTRRLLIALSFGLTLAVGATASTPAFAQNKVEASAKALQKKAMEEDYLVTEFAKAQEKLEKAVAACGTDKCSPGVRALLQRDLGVVLIGGEIDRSKGVQAFAEALKLDPNVQLDPDLKTKELEAAFAEAKKKGGGGGGGGGAKPAPTVSADGQPQGDFTHEPVAEQQIRTPIPVYVEYAGEEPLVKVVVRYKGFGMTEWKTVELKKLGEGWGGQLPCADVQQGVSQYYIQGFNAANDPVATGGDRNNPYKVPVKREKVAEPPHLPGQSPPTQCQDTGDCPPNFPGCKKAPVGSSAAASSSSQEVAGKDGGEFCEEDSECRSGTCDDSKCTEPEGPAKMKRAWIGVWGAFEWSFVPSANSVCSISSTREGQLPLNDKNYYCVNDDNSDFPYRQVQGQSNARDGENDNLSRDLSNKVSGGGAFGNIRIMASFDYALTANWMIGARVGFVALTYPGQAAKDDGATFPPLHLEARGTYLFGKDALMKTFAPYAFLAAGVSTFDAKVKVAVVETDPSDASNRTQREVSAWNIAGPGFFALGGGARVAFAERFAFMGGLKFNMAFGNSFAPSIGPEVGLLVGF